MGLGFQKGEGVEMFARLSFEDEQLRSRVALLEQMVVSMCLGRSEEMKQEAERRRQFGEAAFAILKPQGKKVPS